MAVLPKIIKGFTYGAVIGIFMGLAIYLLAGAVASLGFISTTPTILGGIVFAACIMAGVAMEYADWIDSNASDNNVTPQPIAPAQPQIIYVVPPSAQPAAEPTPNAPPAK